MIRLVRPEDLIEITKIDYLSFPEPYPLILFNQYYEELKEGFFVAEENNIVVGYILNDSSKKEIMSLAVHPEYQGKGIGSQLLEKCLGYFKGKGIKKITVHTRKSNKKAQKFYKHHNFIEKTVVERYYNNGEDGILMEKRL